jgi:hypothetical protein
MSKFKKGIPRPTKAGRKKGVKNLKTQQWEELGKSLIETHSARANQILATCDDDVFIDNFNKLLEYFRPKLARTELTGADGDAIQVRSYSLGKASERNK